MIPSVSVTSPTKVYIETSAKSPHYSLNDVETKMKLIQEPEGLDDRVRLIKALEQTCWLYIRTVLLEGEVEVQDLVAFIGNYVDGKFIYVPVVQHRNHLSTSISTVIK